MKPPPESSHSEYLEITDKIRSGEYFRESQSIYDATIHDLMAERYFYVLITCVAFVIFFVTFHAVQGLYPLERLEPFIVKAEDITEEVPNIKKLLTNSGDDVNESIMRFVVSNYVILREGYNITTIDKSMNGVKSQSTPELYEQYQRYINPENPESPIKIYQRHTVKTIKILAVKVLPQEEDNVAEVLYEATLQSKSEQKKSRWQANISFKYTGIAVDGGNSDRRQIGFTVTQYNNKLLQDIE